MAFHCSTVQKRENQIKSRHADEKGEGDSPDTLATANARQWWLSLHLPSPCLLMVGVDSTVGEVRTQLMLSLIESHCPTVKSCFFPPLISIYVQAALPSFPYFTPPSPTFSTFYPKRKTHKAKHKAMMCLLLLPYSLSLQVVTSLSGPVLNVCIAYFPVLHSSQWNCDLLKFF